MNYQAAKGVFDVLPRDALGWRESHLWQFIESQIRFVCDLYAYREIRTPLFETTELFTRSIGSHTDIVTKEMYTFQDKAGRSLTLRPEGTAPVMRAFIEKNLDQQGPLHKFFYIIPMFRYERQQAGRYRQHHQFGVEAIGSHSPFQDVEVIHLLWSFYERLGLKDLTLHLNSIGDAEARKDFRHKLKIYLRPHFEELSKESQERYEANPLRILDSKDPKDQALLKDAPSILDSLNDASRTHFEQICALLKGEGILYTLNPRLVRGLDYYNNTVFEITSNELGAQNSLGGGGRYDGLLSQLGGPDLPACGFGAGIERIIQTLLAQNCPIPAHPAPLLFIIPLGQEGEIAAFRLTNSLRKHNLRVEMDLTGKKLKNALRYAAASGARFVMVVGENELKTEKVEIKEMATGMTKIVPLNRLMDELQKNA